MTITFRQLLCHTERHAARNNGDLVHRIGIRDFQADESMPGFVISRDAFLFVRDDHALALGAHQDLVFGQLKVGHRDDLLVVTRGVKSSFVNQVRQARAAMTPDSINLIDKNYAGGVLLALFEEVAYARSAYTDEHFDEVRTRN